MLAMHSIRWEARSLDICHRAVLVLAVLGFVGCAQVPQVDQARGVISPGYRPISEQQALYWWRVCFRMPFDEKNAPRWPMDMLLADRIAAPVIERYAHRIPLWRFHRRAAPDSTGHQFSLLFYSDGDTARSIFAEVEANPLIPELISNHYLDRVVVSCGQKNKRSDLGATSDSKWDIRLQKTWPFYIMGVSAHWLALIGELGAKIPAASDDPRDLLARYERILGEINAIWQQEGQHAYLHHLNALFGYQPLLIQKYLRF